MRSCKNSAESRVPFIHPAYILPNPSTLSHQETDVNRTQLTRLQTLFRFYQLSHALICVCVVLFHAVTCTDSQNHRHSQNTELLGTSPVGHVVKTPCFHFRGPRFDPWSGNQDLTCPATKKKKKKKIQSCLFTTRELLHASSLLCPHPPCLWCPDHGEKSRDTCVIKSFLPL